jgi:hypothetical protein
MLVFATLPLCDFALNDDLFLAGLRVNYLKLSVTYCNLGTFDV